MHEGDAYLGIYMSARGPTVVDDPGDLRHAERGNRQPYLGTARPPGAKIQAAISSHSYLGKILYRMVYV